MDYLVLVPLPLLAAALAPPGPPGPPVLLAPAALAPSVLPVLPGLLVLPALPVLLAPAVLVAPDSSGPPRDPSRRDCRYCDITPTSAVSAAA